MRYKSPIENIFYILRTLLLYKDFYYINLMNTGYISFYDSSTSIKASRRITIQRLMNGIKKGEWQHFAEHARKLKGKALTLYKQTKVPAVTVSGVFANGRTDEDLEIFSGYICIDVDSGDNLNLQKRKLRLRQDPYVCGYFTSLSGEGLAVIFKVKGSTFKYAYEEIAKYLEEKYNLKADPSCKNKSRIRFVSWDPDCYWKWDKLQFEVIAPRKIINVPNDPDYDIDDIEAIVKEAERKHKDLVKGYETWYKIGQALAIFGEAGRQFFHRLSRINKREYNKRTCDEQFDKCLEQETKGLRDIRVGPGTIFYIAKLNNVHFKQGPTYVSGRNRG